MGMLGEWRASRERRRLAARYLQTLHAAADPADVHWLTGLTGDGVTATNELGFARRAIALIVAERDALDDRTASDVAHELSIVTDEEARQDAEAGRRWQARWRAYGESLAVRGVSEVPAARLARVLLAGVGVNAPTPDQLTRATQCVHGIRAKANEALRAVFGVASLPDDIRPSAIRS